MDPITDLAARFPCLELTLSGILHSKAHMNKVMHVSVLKVDEVSRPQTRPENVSTDTDESKVEPGPRRDDEYKHAARKGRRTQHKGI